jgi:hypothetical protein
MEKRRKEENKQKEKSSKIPYEFVVLRVGTGNNWV